MKKKGTLIIVSGPSGVGKKTILDLFIKKEKLNIFFSISLTTRVKRPQEENGIDYHFVSKEEFERNIIENKLLEWAEFAGNHYGTLCSNIFSKLENGYNVLLEIEVQGALEVMRKIEKIDSISIFIVPPSIAELRKRLEKRNTESAESIEKRLKKAEKEMHTSSNYDHIVVNDLVETAAEKIEEIIWKKIMNK